MPNLNPENLLDSHTTISNRRDHMGKFLREGDRVWWDTPDAEHIEMLVEAKM